MAKLLARVWTRWRVIAHAIGNFQARLLLSLFYLVLVPAFALVAKLKDPLHLRQRGETSFWRPRPEARTASDSARKQA